MTRQVNQARCNQCTLPRKMQTMHQWRTSVVCISATNTALWCTVKRMLNRLWQGVSNDDGGLLAVAWLDKTRPKHLTSWYPPISDPILTMDILSQKNIKSKAFQDNPHIFKKEFGTTTVFYLLINRLWGEKWFVSTWGNFVWDKNFTSFIF